MISSSAPSISALRNRQPNHSSVHHLVYVLKMPIALDYDVDGNVVGGHYVEKLPERRPAFESPSSGRPASFLPPNLQPPPFTNTTMPAERRRQTKRNLNATMHPTSRPPRKAAAASRAALNHEERHDAGGAQPGSFHDVGFRRNIATPDDLSHLSESLMLHQQPHGLRLQPDGYLEQRDEATFTSASDSTWPPPTGHVHHTYEHASMTAVSSVHSTLPVFSKDADDQLVSVPLATSFVTQAAVAATSIKPFVPHPVPVKSLPDAPHPVESPAISPTLAKARGFIASFTKHFQKTPDAVSDFGKLCAEFNEKAIAAEDFYASVYLILLRNDSLHLLPGFLDFLPPLWKDADLTWLNRAVEDNYKKSSEGESAQSPASRKKALPKKKTKKRPVNGFTTASPADEVHAEMARAGSHSMYINPASLLKYNGSHTMTDRSTSPESAADDEGSEEPLRRIVKLKIGKRLPAAFPKTPPAKRKYARKNSKKTPAPAVSAPPATPGDTSEARELSTPLTRKGRYRYGDHRASEIPHFGHYKTRRAVLARSSRPYVHLVCGQGFSHPHDVKDHHSNTTGRKGGLGCVSKTRDEKQKKLTWDAHESCQIGYPRVNYTKVKDGYVVLDLESAEKIERAVQAGLKYQRDHYEVQQGDETVDEGDSGEDDDAEGTDDDERVDSGNEADADKDVEMPDAPVENVASSVPTEEISEVAMQFGLRRRGARVVYGGM
ncbi:unnamed protein product [Zymoseptoria tritici ST99CH_3D1]|nr:unnamed protein product [Zymoseptoria tritici ST99CH_3D1]